MKRRWTGCLTSSPDAIDRKDDPETIALLHVIHAARDWRGGGMAG